MIPPPKHSYTDWIFGGLLFAFCIALMLMQYRWTGEIANAEMLRLRGNLSEEALAFTRAFDTELSYSCDQLIPVRSDFAHQSREAAYRSRFKAWQSTNPRPIFSRIALGFPNGDKIQLELIDQKSGEFIPTNWPDEWSELQRNLTDKISFGSPPFNDERGVLLEFPGHGGSRERGGPPDSGPDNWLIVELDLTYAREVWLPELAAKYLNPSGSPLNEARVQLANDDSSLVYSSCPTCTNLGASATPFYFNQQGRLDRNSREPTRSGRWLLETWQRPDILEATVAKSRRRNLAVAVGVNLLLFVTGITLLRHTHRTRKLAAQQMNFVANVSHELRTPLTVIRGAAHNLQRGVVSEREQIEKYSSLIIQHCEELANMVEQVLALADAQKNNAVALREPVALAEVLHDAVAATLHDTQAAECQVQLELPPSLPNVLGDASALRRVFQNLITNAAKHGGSGKWIGVTAVLDEDSQTPIVEIQVADHGAGIPPAEQADIFKPFFRGALTETLQIRGSGLGLSLVKEIVLAHGGKISVRSTTGQGAIFTVRLPVAPK